MNMPENQMPKSYKDLKVPTEPEKKCEHGHPDFLTIRCIKCVMMGKFSPTTPQDWMKEFEDKFPPVSQWSSRSGDYTETPIPHIKSFIKKVESESYERGKEEGVEHYTEQLVAKVEGKKLLEAAFSPERLAEKRMYNKALDQILKILKEGYKKGLEELNK